MKKLSCAELTQNISHIFDLYNKVSFVLESKKDVQAGVDAQKEIQQIFETFDFIEVGRRFELAKQLLGEDFIGPDEIKKAFDLETNLKAPPIQFTSGELKQAKELEQFLVFYTNGIPIEKLESFPNGANLKKALNTHWALVTKEIISGSASQTYLEQTERLIDYLQEKVFIGRKIPKEYQEAITEFESKKEKLRPLVGSNDKSVWRSADKKLAGLRISQLCRPSSDELLYAMKVYHEVNQKDILSQEYTWVSGHGFSSGAPLAIVGLVTIGSFVSYDRSISRNNNVGSVFSRTI